MCCFNPSPHYTLTLYVNTDRHGEIKKKLCCSSGHESDCDPWKAPRSLSEVFCKIPLQLDEPLLIIYSNVNQL